MKSNGAGKTRFSAALIPPSDRQPPDEPPVIQPIELPFDTHPAVRSGQRRHRLLNILFLILALALLVAGGGGLIAYLSRHPIYVDQKIADPAPPQPSRAPEQTPEPPAPGQQTAEPSLADKTMQPVRGEPAIEPALGEKTIKTATADGLEPESKPPAAEKGQAVANDETAQKVHSLIASGKAHEENNQMAFALADYQAAVKADPESAEARTALERAKRVMVAARFKELMSEGMTAFHRKDYPLARKKLMEAGSIGPGSPEVKNALAQVDAAVDLARIESLHQSARQAESAEDWERALSDYQAALSVDPNLAFAVDGLKRAERYSRWVREIRQYIEKPSLLELDRHLAKALRVLEDAGADPPRGERFAEDLGELEKLVRIAQTPVKVVIQSDNLTDVAVYKVGRLGQFEKRELNLRPGTYTVVGGRPGYRDVRRKIRVAAGETRLQVTIKCTEKI